MWSVLFAAVVYFVIRKSFLLHKTVVFHLFEEFCDRYTHYVTGAMSAVVSVLQSRP